MLNFLALVLLVMLFAVGQVLFKKAALSIGDGNFLWELLNGWTLAALILYGFTTVLWIWILQTVPLNLAYAFTSLAFLIVPLAAYIAFGETLSIKYAVGCGLIVTGVIITST